MLVLTRKDGERVFVGDAIVVTVVSIEGNRVRLGFQAPSDVSIRREGVTSKAYAELECVVS